MMRALSYVVYRRINSFKNILELVYCTEISNLTSTYTTFRPEQFLYAVAHFCKLYKSFLKHFWKSFFDTSLTDLVAFAVLSEHP
jgi:hypothetical protein